MTSLRRDKVLVVDDDAMIRLLARQALEIAEFDVAEACDGPDAIETFHRLRPDVVLVDVMMPRSDGFTVCQEIRSSSEGADTPVIIVTALGDVESISRAYGVGATDFVTKPIQWQVLGHRLRHIIRARRTAHELDENRKSYQMLFQSNPHPMWVFDLDTLAFRDVNDAAIGKYGYSREEFLQMTIKDIRPPEDIPRLCRNMAVISDGFDDAGIWRHCRKDGSIIDVEIISHTILFAGEKAQVVTAHDVTERLRSERALLQSEERYRSLFNGVSDIIYAIAPDRSFAVLNTAFETVTGWLRREWIGRDFLELIHPLDREKALSLFQGAFDGKLFPPFELRLVGSSGETVTIEATVRSQLHDGTVTELHGIARDLTERKRAESELQRVDRALRTVSQCNQALVYATNERDLLVEICRSIVGNRGYRFAWVGYALNDHAKTVVAVAKAGDDDGYLDEIEVTWGDRATARGPAGTAIRTGQPNVIKNLGADERFTPWVPAASRRGFNSAIALPLMEKQGVFGVLVIYASETGAFDDAEVELLKELASNLSYGITTLRVRDERLRAEGELKKSQLQLKEALHLAKLGSWSWNGEGECAWSDEVYTILEVPSAEASPPFAEQAQFFAPDSWLAFREAVERALKTADEFHLELQAQTATGNTKWLMARGAPLSDSDGHSTGRVHGTWQDITERKVAQLKEAQLQRRLLAMWNIGRMVDANFTSLNETVLMETVAITGSCYGFFGYLNEEETVFTTHAWSASVLNCCAIDGSSLEFRVANGGAWTEAIRLRRTVIINDYQQGSHRAIKGLPEGHIPLRRIMVVPVLVRDRIAALSVVANKEGDYTLEDAEQVEAFLNNVQILLEKRKVEETLALLSQAVEQSPVSIVITDTEGTIEFVNPKFSQLTGYSREEALGQNPRFMQSGRVSSDQYRRMWDVLLAGGTWNGEFLNKKKSGEVILEAAVISPVKNREGTVTHYLAVKEDITDKRKLEEQLRHAQKMEAVGTLAGGIAHDFNNILTSVLGYCAMMEKKVADGDPLRGYLAKVIGAANRAASLTKGLLTYSRKEPAQTRPIDINTLLVQAEHLLSRLLSEDIELMMRPCPTPLVVLGDSLQLEQVLMNMAANARDALPYGGVITIASSLSCLADDVPINSEWVKAGKYAVITVSDNGSGMGSDVVERIFEPFYTTKEVGKGTGLGLSITYGIVKQHDGYIDVESSPGTGTTFTIYIPLDNTGEADGPSSSAAEIERGTETILLVEDDEGIREIFTEVLEDSGYKVVTAADGEEGVRKFRGQGGSVALVILDVIMPKKNGVAVFDEIKRDRPDIKGLFISGYSAEILNERALLGNQNVLLVPKPITPEMLLSKVREVLDPVPP